jgi:hypothetical protein
VLRAQSYSTCGSQNTFDAWFGSGASSSGTTHTLPQLATVITNYVQTIVDRA